MRKCSPSKLRWRSLDNWCCCWCDQVKLLIEDIKLKFQRMWKWWLLCLCWRCLYGARICCGRMKMWHINNSCFRANCLALITVDIGTVPIILLAFLFCNDIPKESKINFFRLCSMYHLHLNKCFQITLRHWWQGRFLRTKVWTWVC